MDLRSLSGGDAATERIFTPAALVRQMLAFERALAWACADAGLMPAEAAGRIDAAAGDGSWIDVGEVLRGAQSTGTPVIPLLAALRARLDPEDAAQVHLGATSQDVVDSAVMLQVSEGLAALEGDLRRIAAVAAALASQHRATPMIGRTLLRHAVPISFGLRAARWLATATRGVRRLQELSARTALQFGGAAGTLLPLGDAAADVEAALGRRLGLTVPELPWHAERDRLADLVGGVGVLAGAVGKVAGDLLLLSQEEVGEVAFEAGGGSSAMPHKRNPVDPIYAATAARLSAGAVSTFLHAMNQEHERAAGGWQAEWVLVADAFRSSGACLHRVAAAVEQLSVDPERMAANLASSAGLVSSEALASALAPHMGGAAARALTSELIRTAASTRAHLATVAARDERVTAALGDDLDAVFDPTQGLGSADRFIDRALAAYRELPAGADAGDPAPPRRQTN